MLQNILHVRQHPWILGGFPGCFLSHFWLNPSAALRTIYSIFKPQRAMGLVNERDMDKDNDKIWSAAVTKSDDLIDSAEDADGFMSGDDKHQPVKSRYTCQYEYGWITRQLQIGTALTFLLPR